MTFLTLYIPLIFFLTLLLLLYRSQTLIYNIFSSIIDDDCHAGNLISLLYDQHGQFLIIPNYTITENSKNNIFIRNFRHFNSKTFIAYLEKVNWDNTLNVFDGNVNKSFPSLSNIVTYILDQHMHTLSLVWRKCKAVKSHGSRKEF